MTPTIKFHEHGRTYIWNVASREVRTESGLLVSKECFNLQQARKKVRGRYQ